MILFISNPNLIKVGIMDFQNQCVYNIIESTNTEPVTISFIYGENFAQRNKNLRESIVNRSMNVRLVDHEPVPNTPPI